MVEYSQVNVKLTDTQLKKKTAVNNSATTLRMSLKMLGGDDLPHEFLLATKQRTKLRNTFNNNMSTDINFLKLKFLKLFNLEDF